MQRMTFDEFRNYVKGYVGSGLNRIYLHWSAGSYENIEPAYHISIGKDGDFYVMHDLTELLAATWRRNTNSVSISMMCARGAVAYNRHSCDLGDNPPTLAQVQTMAKLVAIMCEEFGWDIVKDRIMTHGEIADIDDYGIDDDDPDMRWDLLLVPDSDGQLKPGGDVVRGMAIWYDQHRESIA